MTQLCPVKALAAVTGDGAGEVTTLTAGLLKHLPRLWVTLSEEYLDRCQNSLMYDMKVFFFLMST